MKDRDEELLLIQTATDALSSEQWIVGQCAAKWTRKHARGRTDADFGLLIGLDGDGVFKRRRVFETFADVRTNYAHLTWSHFYAAVAWDDSAECLAWADEQAATVAEMKAWRRMQHGEDLTVDEEFESSEELPEVSAPERKLDALHLPEDSREGAEPRREEPTMATLETDQPETTYAPYRSTSGATAPRDDNGDGASRDAVLIRKTCVAVGRAIIKTDDAREFVTELLAECWRQAPGDTADAIKLFTKDKPLCR